MTKPHGMLLFSAASLRMTFCCTFAAAVLAASLSVVQAETIVPYRRAVFDSYNQSQGWIMDNRVELFGKSTRSHRRVDMALQGRFRRLAAEYHA